MVLIFYETFETAHRLDFQDLMSMRQFISANVVKYILNLAKFILITQTKIFVTFKVGLEC